MASRSWSRGLVGAAFLLTACDADVVLLEPEKADASDAVTLTVQVSDSNLARRLGWSPGTGVPGATVRIRQDERSDVQSFVTDDQGVLRLDDLPSALYWIWVEKQLDPGAASAGAPPVLGGGRRTGLKRGDSVSVAVRGNDRGSLVISEVYYHDPPFAVTGGDDAYDYHYYVELYNNSDTTIYLDGKIVGGAFSVAIDISSWPCTETATWRNDPRGVWAQSFQRFPGSGREHALASGGVVVIAEQAIDHSAIYPGLPDLSHADFQFSWQDRALNPDVPTMLPVALRTPTKRTMGIAFYVPFVADVPNLASLERTFNLQLEFALFPRESLLDIAQIALDTYQLPRESRICGNSVEYSLDALMSFASPSRLHADAHLLTARRRLLPDGVALQRTGVSAVDWEMAPRSPGRVR
ncbi:MAG: DUF4876 domain-containing protein [Longimicrobiales bacterium]|nr:DUF4876 domain-containing protein [Longimicrobiales bacterium]